MKKIIPLLLIITSVIISCSQSNILKESNLPTPTASVSSCIVSPIPSPTPTEIPKIIPEMVLVEGGTFKMGDVWESDKSENSWGNVGNEKPVHKVTLTYDFYIGKYEVTQKEYGSLIKFTPLWFKGDRFPVETVTWFDAIKYCNYLSKQEDLSVAYDEKTGNLLDSSGNVTTDITKVLGYRLPTEAEWEYSTRGGKYSKGYKYSGSNDVNEVSTIWDSSNPKLYEVGLKKPNELGLYDMTGSLLEMCTDTYSKYSEEDLTNPYIFERYSIQDCCVARGGAWNVEFISSTVSSRVAIGFEYTTSGIGFRIAKTK